MTHLLFSVFEGRGWNQEDLIQILHKIGSADFDDIMSFISGHLYPHGNRTWILPILCDGLERLEGYGIDRCHHYLAYHKIGSFLRPNCSEVEAYMIFEGAILAVKKYAQAKIIKPVECQYLVPDEPVIA